MAKPQLVRPLRFLIFVLHSLRSGFAVYILLAQTSSARKHDETKTGFSFSSFSDKSNITLLQSASIGKSRLDDHHNKTLLLTPSSPNASGRALHYQPIRVRHATTNNVLQFSTSFKFATLKSTEPSGEGLAFIMTPDSVTTGEDGGFLGWLTEATDGNPSGHAFAVEFDSRVTPWCNDPDNNHIGVNVNSLQSMHIQGSGMYLDANAYSLAQIDLSADHPLYAWIDYNWFLNVTISKHKSKPAVPLISVPIDLAGIVNDFMYVGFTSATGDFDSTGAEVTTEVYQWNFQTGAEVVNPAGKLQRHWQSMSASVSVALLLIFLAVWNYRSYLKRKNQRRDVTNPTELVCLHSRPLWITQDQIEGQ